MTVSAPLILVAAAALVSPQHKLLLAERPPGKAMAGLWELPGGKVEAQESPEAALVRELKEELGLHVQEEELNPLTFASHPYAGFHLLMPVFACFAWGGEAVAQEGQRIAWAAADELERYPMLPADMPLMPVLGWLLRH